MEPGSDNEPDLSVRTTKRYSKTDNKNKKQNRLGGAGGGGWRVDEQ